MGLKSDLIYYSKLCSKSGFVKANDGNLSVRTKYNYILSTASRTNKQNIKLADLLKCDINGKKLSGNRELSTELKLHLFIYKKRNDINAVIHSHPLYITSYSAAREKLSANLLPEIYMMFGKIPLAKFASPSTDEVPKSIEPFIKKYNAVILANHGLVVYGRTLEETFFMTVKLEQYANICFNAKMLGVPKFLTKQQLKKLDELKNTNYKSYFN